MANRLIDIQIEGAESLLKMRDLLNPKLIDKATKGGISYAAKAAKVAVAKEVRARYNIPSARVKQDVTGPRFSNGGQLATIYLSQKPISAISYGGKDTGKGLTMKVFKSVRAKRVQRGFIVKSGRYQGLPFARKDKERTPIQFVYGPSIGRIFAGDSRFGPELRAAVEARINEQFIKGMQRVLDSAARGYGG
jgi:hypothetical protein